MTKGLDERIYEGLLWWFGPVERMEMDRITTRVYIGESTGSHSDVRQARRMVQDLRDWQVCEGECIW